MKEVSRFSNVHTSRVFRSRDPQSLKNRYKGANLERARNLFEQEIEKAIVEDVKSFY